MKKTTRPKKLALRLETVRVLTSQDLLLVAGGACRTCHRSRSRDRLTHRAPRSMPRRVRRPAERSP